LQYIEVSGSTDDHLLSTHALAQHLCLPIEVGLGEKKLFITTQQTTHPIIITWSYM